jgi:alpha-glucosidase (family GH31 glycosyl hydrolase)
VSLPGVPSASADAPQLLHDLKQDGFKTVTIIDPGVKYEPEADYEVLRRGTQEGLFCTPNEWSAVSRLCLAR